MTHKLLLCTCTFLLAVAGQTGSRSEFLARYKGTPFTDQRYTSGMQPIPGRVEAAYFDLGGEGVAYHDSDRINHGSGELNAKGTAYQDHFRVGEGVDTSYTKFNRPVEKIDDNPYDGILPEADQLYVGWTVPGEWFNLTVNVAHDGLYDVGLLYTAHNDGTLTVDVNGIPQGVTIPVASTFNAKEPIAWRQWHHWNLGKKLAKLRLVAGRNVLTVHIATGGQMNLAYFDMRDAR